MKKFYEFTDDRMFCQVLVRNQELLREMTELILGREIDRIEVLNAQQILNYSTDAKFIRLDIYYEDGENEMYDMEMEKGSLKYLAKRCRVYHANMDTQALKPGKEYKDLSKGHVIFICRKDPFGKGKGVYKFRTMCEGYPEIVFDDGMYTYVVNAEARDDDTLTSEMKDFLEYLCTGRPKEVGLTKSLHDEVSRMNRDSRWRDWIMTLEQQYLEMREDILQEGREEGFREGRLRLIKEVFNNLLVEHTYDEAIREAMKLFGIRESELNDILSSASNDQTATSQTK